jgi:hypothetical protein
MKKMMQTIGTMALMMSLAFSASAQGGKKPKGDDGKRPSEIVRQPKGNDQGRGGQAPKSGKPSNDNRGGNDRGDRGSKPKKPDNF